MSDRLDLAIRELVAALREEAAPASSNAPDRLLSIDAAADVLNVSRTTLYGELQAGRLRSVKVGRRRLIPAGAIAERVEGAPFHNGTPQEVESDRSHTAAPA